jgi:CRISPR-associated protein Csm5
MLSPLFIGAGEEHVISPYCDFVQRGDSLIYIDTDRLQEAMQGDDALVEAFVKGMRRFENNRSTFSLEHFIIDILGREVDDFAARVVRIDGDVQKNHIRRFIATGGKPFIPGSSLKGAIRTAVLVDWLLKTNEGKKQLSEIKMYVEKRNWKSLRMIDPERVCFGSRANDAFRYLRVSDSETLEQTDLSVSSIKRVCLKFGREGFSKRRSDIPQWSETLKTFSKTSFSLSMVPSRGKTTFSFFNDTSLISLFAIINKVSLYSCLRELHELEGNRDFIGFLRFYEKLKYDIQSIEQKEAVLRLGGGKTWFDNSIGLSVNSYDFGPDFLFGGYLKLLRIGNLPFPSTRSAIVKGNEPVQPLGWVKLSILD